MAIVACMLPHALGARCFYDAKTVYSVHPELRRLPSRSHLEQRWDIRHKLQQRGAANQPAANNAADAHCPVEEPAEDLIV